jgi:tetratricopeptide (TPR) repeat protein
MSGRLTYHRWALRAIVDPRMRDDEDLARQSTVTPPAAPTLTTEPRPATAATAPAGEHERYVRRDQLGRGGMGTIMTAFDRKLGRTVAIKEVRGGNADLEARFEREIVLSAKLEHPSIVTIHDSGIWPSGEPFYVMRLVPGRGLDVAIDKARDLRARLALVPHVIAVADALAYAHDQRVIHRDLKPHNVMIGDFGETVVIDWGLAKQLAGSRPSTTDLHTPSPSAETRAGDVLGTPAYMPPEQARGIATDERADVYAIGAILYHLLSGQPPYDGTATEVLEAAKHRAPSAIETVVPDVPRDLAAIIGRAMARAPENRYPTARELADDLRAFQAGRLVGAHRYSPRELFRRWLQRHRAAIGVAAAALLALIGIGATSLYRIVQARHIAEQNRAQAEGLVDFVVTDLSTKLSTTGHSDLLLTALERVSTYFVEHAPATPAERKRYAAFRDLYGRVLLERGDTVGALRETRAAHDLVVELAREGTDLNEVAVSADVDLADALHASGQSDEAVAVLRGAVARAERVVAEHPDDVERLHELARAHGSLGGELGALGQYDAARGELTANLDLAQKLLASHRGDRQFTQFVVAAHDHLGTVEAAVGNREAAIGHYRAMLELLTDLSTRAPEDAMCKYDLADAHTHLANQYRVKGDYAGALAEYDASASLLQALLTSDPGNTNVSSEITQAWIESAKVYMLEGKIEPARADLEKAIAVARPLAARDPANIRWTYQLSDAEVALGDLLSGHDTKTAIASYRDALVLRERVLAAEPNKTLYLDGVAYVHRSMGEELCQTNDEADGRVELRSSIAMYERVLAATPDDAQAKQSAPQVRDELAHCPAR